jgi:hypothetical protein
LEALKAIPKAPINKKTEFPAIYKINFVVKWISH